ncbi:hypothetical protein QSJ18_19560 [Gordonia sp. ABSL1-1]|uniref:hypothetical protein n=1 Tax=Gordonia sp. ABSL1-1 TaxID=3053923 RepID=UPI0025743D7B|nr:hypothetical protein [Gordonia sp. ABSL1-1]MDL9938948.1 hypothetical protein [Gordonia sp. ABSL1-1]
MAYPDKEMIQDLNFDRLRSVSKSASLLSDLLEKDATFIYDVIARMDWSGIARDAAETKAYNEKKSYNGMSDSLAHVASVMDQAEERLTDLGQRIKTEWISAEDDEYSVSKSGWNVADSRVYDEDSDTAIRDERATEALNIQSRLVALAREFHLADSLASLDLYESMNTLEGLTPVSAGTTTRDQRSFDIFLSQFGREPKTPVDFATATALNPETSNRIYKDHQSNVIVIPINPVPGGGVVRVGQFIQERDVSNLTWKNPAARNAGDNRGPDINFDPQNARVTTYIDYENGVVIMRQNPSVRIDEHGIAKDQETGSPKGTVYQAPDGSVAVTYEAADPIGLGGETSRIGMGVNGTIVATPGVDGAAPTVGGFRTDYPWMEVHHTSVDGAQSTVTVDRPQGLGTGSSVGPALNLNRYHEFGPESESGDAHHIEGAQDAGRPPTQGKWKNAVGHDYG